MRRRSTRVGMAVLILVTACSPQSDEAHSPTVTTNTSAQTQNSTAGSLAPTTLAGTVTTSDQALPDFPAQPQNVPWPTTEWTLADPPQGVDVAALDRATDVAFADGGPQRVRAVVVVYGGAIVYERYSPSLLDGPDEVMPSYTIAKSVTATVVGSLIADGRLTIDEPAPVPEWHDSQDDPMSEVTVEQMLHMSTGVEWTDGLDPGTAMSEMVSEDDMASYAAEMEPIWAPGEIFDYNTGTTTLLARIIGDIVGSGGADTRAYLDSELFDVIGMNPVHTQFDEAETWLGGFSADTTARNYAKFGLLHLRGGEWDGVEVVPRSWVEYERTPSPAEPEYGAHWWLDTARPGFFYAVGVLGQVITVDPAHDLVSVQLSTVGGSLPLDHTEAILDAFSDIAPPT